MELVSPLVNCESASDPQQSRQQPDFISTGTIPAKARFRFAAKSRPLKLSALRIERSRVKIKSLAAWQGFNAHQMQPIIPHVEIATVTPHLTSLLALLDRFPHSQNTHAPWLQLRASVLQLDVDLAWLAGHFHYQRNCPVCGRRWQITLDTLAAA